MAAGEKRSITTPPSTWVCPKNECPWPRIATLSPWRLANCHELRDVLRIAGPEHGDWLLVHDMSSSADDCRTASSKYNSPLRYFTL